MANGELVFAELYIESGIRKRPALKIHPRDQKDGAICRMIQCLLVGHQEIKGDASTGLEAWNLEGEHDEIRPEQTVWGREMWVYDPR